MNELDNFVDGPFYPPNETSIFDYSTDIPYHPGSDNI